MYLQVLLPPPPVKKGQPPAVSPTLTNPDALAATTQAETTLESQHSFSMSGYHGLGCGGGECHCGGKCHGAGMGLFDSGSDTSGWGLQEWSVIGLGIFGLFMVIDTLASGARSARRTVRRVRSRRRRRAALKEELQQT